MPRFGIGNVLEDSEHDVVADEALGGAEEAKVAHDDLALVSGEFVGLPQFDVALHWDFGGHPMICTAVEVMFPSPFVLKRHELIHVHGAAVQQSLVLCIDLLGEIVRSRAFVSGIAARHNRIWLWVRVGKRWEWIWIEEKTMPQFGVRPISEKADKFFDGRRFP